MDHAQHLNTQMEGMERLVDAGNAGGVEPDRERKRRRRR